MERQYHLIILINIIILLIIAIVLCIEAYTPKTNIVNAKPRSVWPEDSADDAKRITEQMVYVPDGYRYELAPVKRILIYTGLGSDWEKPRLDGEEFAGCPVSRCSLTVDKSNGSEVDAVLFRHAYERPEFKRPPNQIWILSHSEAPFHTNASSDANVFNWTTTYRWDSDLPYLLYGYFKQNHHDDVRIQPKTQTIERNFAANKTKKVAWFVSNCNGNSNRTAYVEELQKHIPVDVYGDCGPLKCPRSSEDLCFRMLEEDYKFYLAFENAHCRHYITEKLFKNAMSHDVLPIVMGPRRSDYEMVVPNGSFIHVDDFESPKLLAEYLKKLDNNDELYNQYFQWKNTGKIVMDTKYYCRLCAMLHDEGHSPKHYEDINKWWMGPGVCER